MKCPCCDPLSPDLITEITQDTTPLASDLCNWVCWHGNSILQLLEWIAIIPRRLIFAWIRNLCTSFAILLSLSDWWRHCPSISGLLAWPGMYWNGKGHFAFPWSASSGFYNLFWVDNDNFTYVWAHLRHPQNAENIQMIVAWAPMWTLRKILRECPGSIGLW